MTSIFVAKLDFGVTSEQLKEAFGQYGTVLKATVATDRETGKSRGFGFVEMEDANEAKNAIAALDNYQFNGRPISVKEAEQREKRPAREPFKPGFQKNNDTGAYKKLDTPISNAPIVDPEEFTKIISKVSSVDKTKKEKETAPKKKKSGMQAYKKSGKTPRFDQILDEEDDLVDWKSSSKKSKQFEDDDEEDVW